MLVEFTDVIISPSILKLLGDKVQRTFEDSITALADWGKVFQMH